MQLNAIKEIKASGRAVKGKWEMILFMFHILRRGLNVKK